MFTGSFRQRGRLGVFGLLASVVFVAGFELARGGQFSAKLTELRFTGSQRFSEAEIIAASALKLGSSVSPADFAAVANRLSGLGVFSSVRYRYEPNGDGVAARFEVVDAENLWPCRFSNFVWFSQEELLAALRARVPLFAGQVPPRGSQLENVRAALEAILKERGVPGHVTSALEESPAAGRGRAVFTVEGVLVVVHEIELPGVTQIDRETLGRLSGAVVGEKYDQGVVGTFYNSNLKFEYGNRGYLRAAVEPPSIGLVKHEGPETWVRVTFRVSEGAQYHIGAIHWTGNSGFTEAELSSPFGLKPGDVANEGLVEKGLALVRMLYAKRGYARARLQPTPTFNDERHEVNYLIRVEEGSIYRMGKLTIAGLDAATTVRLEDACHLTPGQVYDGSYWMTYLKSITGLLPIEFRQMPPALKEDFDEAAKSVNVTLDFGTKTRP